MMQVTHDGHTIQVASDGYSDCEDISNSQIRHVTAKRLREFASSY